MEFLSTWIPDQVGNDSERKNLVYFDSSLFDFLKNFAT